MLDYEEPSELFEKPRGERRWLGKEHHRGKERLFNSVKDRTFIEKALSTAEPMSKRSANKLKASVNDGLEPNVVYSLDKKNRWRDANTVTLLGTAPGDVNAEVVQKNGLEQFGFLHPNKSTFSVDTRVMYKDDAPGEFGIRRATSSGKGQDYSNFLPKTRELSKKANARVEKQEQQDQLPTVSYNIYKTHRSLDVVGGQMFKAKVVGKSGRHRANKKVDMEVYEYFSDLDDDEEDDEVEEFSRRADAVLDLSEHMVSLKSRKKAPEPQVKLIETLKPVCEFPEVLNTHEILHSQGFTFEETNVKLEMKDNFAQQMKMLKLEKGLKVKDLRPEQYLVDASEWCQMDDGSKDGQTTTVIVITRLTEGKLNVLVNSTIATNPSQKGWRHLNQLICRATSILELISRITSKLWMNRVIMRNMKLSSAFYNRKSAAEMLNDTKEWESQLINMSWPNRHYHASWANSPELSSMGSVLEWKELCEMAKKKDQMERTCYPSSEDVCGVCSRQKRSHELYLTTDEFKIKCSECLREQFYKELSARRIPIDLKIDVADELEYLQSFIPLPVLNAYIRKVATPTVNTEKCESCNSALTFDLSSSTLNRSCPCGYCWCHECKGPPHWPMKCGEFAKWNEKWALSYSLVKAQGSGGETLLRVTCSCGKAIYSVRLPADTMKCPVCKIHVDTKLMRTCVEVRFRPLSAVLRKYTKRGWYTVGWDFKGTAYQPIDQMHTRIDKVLRDVSPMVTDFCALVHDDRYDEITRNRAVHREHVLIRKGILEKPAVENAMGTVVYLAETLTAWMHVTNRNDQNVKKTLKRMLENRKKLVEVLETEDGKKIGECLATIRRDIDSVLAAVERLKSIRIMQ